MSEKQAITFKLNGQNVSADVPSDMLLSDCLRHELNLTGTKEACGVGVCGLCTVWVNGRTISSCIMPALFADQADVYTAEGLQSLLELGEHVPEGAPDPRLWKIVQDAFVECQGMQCGICTPGQVMSALDLLTDNPRPDRDEIVHFMAGNLCRCTGYQSIIRAIQLAAERWEMARASV